MLKQKILIGTSVIALTLTACSEDWGGSGNESGNGYIVPSIMVDSKTYSSNGSATRAILDELTENDLTLVLTKADGTVVWEGKYEEFPTDKAFSVGKYTMEAKYGNAEEQGFDKPALYGFQDLTVAEGKTTELSFTAVPSNSQITMNYSDAFKNYMKDWSATVNSLAYEKEEERPVYVTPGEVVIRLNVTKPNDVTGQLALDPVTAKARYCHNILVDINDGEAGDAQLKIEFDDTLDEETIFIDLSDKVLQAPAPTVEPEGFVSNEPVRVISGLSESGNLSMTLLAQSGIKAVNMTTSSPSLVKQGWPEVIDLVKADSNQQTVLTNLGLSVLGLWKNVGEMAYIDFSEISKNITADNSGNNTNTIEVTVVDKYSRESDPVILNLNVEPVKLELASAGDFYTPGNPLAFNFSFNGTKEDIEDGKVKFQYYDSTGMWRDAKTLSVKNGENGYLISIELPLSHNKEVKLRAVCGINLSGELLIPIIAFEVAEVNPDNVFATYAFVTLEEVPGKDISKANPVFLIKDGTGNYVKAKSTNEEGIYKITGLNPSTSYQIKVSDKEQSFTTEASLALPNGNFENYFEAYNIKNMLQGGKYRIVFTFQNEADCIYNEAQGWTTSNAMTMGGKTANTWFCQPSVFASNSSYTGKGDNNVGSQKSSRFTFPGNGENSIALVIRNIGWHPNGTLPSTESNAGGFNSQPPASIEKFIGKAVLGSYLNQERSEIEEGIPFSSRPAQLKGVYNYTLDDSGADDQGKVTVKVLNGNDIIGTGEAFLSHTSDNKSFQPFSVDIKYIKNSPKADRVCVIIESSKQDVNSVAITPHNNRYESFFHGATLVVDDFEFVY